MVGRNISYAVSFLIAYLIGCSASAREPVIPALERGYYVIKYLADDRLGFEKADEMLHLQKKIELLAEQLTDADHYYSGTLRLVPLVGSAGRFRAVSKVEVEVVENNRIMGAAGGGVIKFDREKNSHLNMMISSRWRPGNRTPEHEVFHLYQYAHTRIANKWYLEGMAGSMHQMFDGVVSHSTPIPGTAQELRMLFSTEKDASSFWRRLYSLCDVRCRPDAERNVFWSSTSNPCPNAFIKSFLSWLRDDELGSEGSKIVNWAREFRLAESNNLTLARGLRFAIESSCSAPFPEELRRFDRELAIFINSGH